MQGPPPLPPLPHDPLRWARGSLLARRPHGVRPVSPSLFLVTPSSGHGRSYEVHLLSDSWRCTCQDFVLRTLPCKHTYAVREHLLGIPSAPSPPPRPSYPQDWPAYNRAQMAEEQLFPLLLSGLLAPVRDPRPPASVGRPRLPLSDTLFCAILKVHSLLSLRRSYGRFQDARIHRHIRTVPSFVQPSLLFRREDLTSTLHQLIATTARPLSDLERRFAVDATGLRTTSFGAYCQEAHGPSRQNVWLKLHVIIGVESQIIPGVVVTASNANDAPQFPTLVDAARAAGFQMEEILGDKGYLSRANMEVAGAVGAIPYIPFKKGSTGAAKGSPLWSRMYRFFLDHREEFEQHYHLRSNVEATFAALKRKLGETLRSKDPIARVNEVLAKVICHNLMVVIHEMHEHQVTPRFLRAKWT